MEPKEEIEKVLEKALSYSKAEQTEAVAAVRSLSLTRFFNSEIHQNMAEKNVHLSVRVIKNKRIGWASSHSFEEKALKKTVDLALKIGEIREPDFDFKTLPSPKPLPKKECFFEETYKFSPEERTQAVQKIITKVHPVRGLASNGVKGGNFKAAGAFRTGGGFFGVANSLGVKALSSLSEASLNVVIDSETSSGYASFLTGNVREIDSEALAEKAMRKAAKSQNPYELEPGNYPVILEPEAVAEMIAWLGFAGLGALSLQEKRSFMSGKIGEKIVGENITLFDNALDPRLSSLPFDFEGVPKQKVNLIKNGVAKGVVYDSYTAFKEGKESTGHGLPAPNPYGPLPLNLVLKEGKSTFTEMIASTEKGILVTRFHYTNLEDPLRTIFTGMTRDGTFLIEKGKIKKGIKNLRFTQNILEALSKVEEVSKTSEAKEIFGFGVSLVPALKISEFNFTGLSPT